MIVEVTYEGAALLRRARLGLLLVDAERDVDTYLVDQIVSAIEAQGHDATATARTGQLRLRVEFEVDA